MSRVAAGVVTFAFTLVVLLVTEVVCDGAEAEFVLVTVVVVGWLVTVLGVLVVLAPWLDFVVASFAVLVVSALAALVAALLFAADVSVEAACPACPRWRVLPTRKR